MARILVVDDDQVLRNIMARHLSAHGYEVVTAAGGMEALKILDTLTPDLMTLDIGMPGMNGYEVCRIIRKESPVKSLPILIISGNTHPEDQTKAFEMGADKYITKPFEMTEVLLAIKTLLDRNKVRSQAWDKAAV